MFVGTFGNHEFDEGIGEALRLVYGGNHEDGPFLEKRWQGAQFPYISANVIEESTGRPVLPPYTIKLVDGIAIGFITSEPAPIASNTGVKPMMSTNTVISFGRRRNAAPSYTAFSIVSTVTGW